MSTFNPADALNESRERALTLKKRMDDQRDEAFGDLLQSALFAATFNMLLKSVPDDMKPMLTIVIRTAFDTGFGVGQAAMMSSMLSTSIDAASRGRGDDVPGLAAIIGGAMASAAAARKQQADGAPSDEAVASKMDADASVGNAAPTDAPDGTKH